MNLEVTNYDTETQTMTIKLDTGSKLEISMKYRVVDLNGIGYEYDFIDDTLNDVFYKINESFHSASEIIQWAENNHNDIHSEALQDEADEADHIREVSSPYWSGRI